MTFFRLITTGLMSIATAPLVAAPTDDFVTTWKTDNPGTSNPSSITVPITDGLYDVDWDNDGIFDQLSLFGPVTHDFGVIGTYTIRIRSANLSIRFSNRGDGGKILSLDQWGTGSWTSMELSFAGAENLLVPATDTPDFSAVTVMSGMFYDATSVNPDTSGWDTSSVIYMDEMFTNATSANPDTSGWDTSSVRGMLGMFSNAASANPDTSGWDTSSVTTTYRMFWDATLANPDTSGWDTSSVTDMRGMFWYATSADPDVSSWDTSSVTNMGEMFYNATSANPDTSGWDTSSVSGMSEMFHAAISFDRDIGSWDVTSLISAREMFTGVTLSTANYESLLIGWNAQTLQAGVIFHGGNSAYCSAEALVARTNMIVSDSWVITDGGQQCPPASPIVAPDLTPETDTGISDSDNFTTNNTPAFFVVCSAVGNIATLYTDHPAENTAVGTLLCLTEGTEIAAVTSALLASIHNVTYTLTNGDGESGHSPSLEVNIDLIYANSFESQQITTIVDDPENSVGHDSSIVIGTDNFPVISYSDGNANMLKVAKCNDTACSGNDETITSVTFGGRHTSMAISQDGFPVISHRNGALLMVTKCNDVACAGGDELTTQVDDSLGSVRCTSLAISRDGYPVIAYGNGEDNVLQVAKCDDVACTGGGEVLSVVYDPTEHAGFDCSLAIGHDGNPVISSVIVFIIPSSLVVTKCNDAACVGNDETTITLDGPNPISQSSIAIGIDNNPVISYRFAGFNQLRVAHCNDAACTGNDELLSIVDDVDDVGEFNSIAIGDDGFPVISYFDRTAGALKVAKCNDEACTGSNETITTLDDPPTFAGFHTSITIGDDGRPVISYWQYDESGAKLKVTRCGNPSCDD